VHKITELLIEFSLHFKTHLKLIFGFHIIFNKTKILWKYVSMCLTKNLTFVFYLFSFTALRLSKMQSFSILLIFYNFGKIAFNKKTLVSFLFHSFIWLNSAIAIEQVVNHKHVPKGKRQLLLN